MAGFFRSAIRGMIFLNWSILPLEKSTISHSLSCNQNRWGDVSLLDICDEPHASSNWSHESTRLFIWKTYLILLSVSVNRILQLFRDEPSALCEVSGVFWTSPVSCSPCSQSAARKTDQPSRHSSWCSTPSWSPRPPAGCSGPAKSKRQVYLEDDIEKKQKLNIVRIIW